MLNEIKDYVARYAEVIAKITGIDAEVVDRGLIRIAGTGIYCSGIGQPLADGSSVYRHVLRIKRTFLLDTPRDHAICQKCGEREFCRETLSLSTPILHDGEAIGVIGLVCFNDAERSKIMAHRNVYTDFIEQCAEMINLKLEDGQRYHKSQEFMEIMLKIVDVGNKSIVVFNAAGGVAYLNKRARKDLNIEGDAMPTEVKVKRTGESFSDMDEFVFSLRGRKVPVVGQEADLSARHPYFSKVFVFDSLSNMAERVGTITTDAATPGLEGILGTSPQMRKLKEQIRKVAKSTSTVLITGESGTGKELAARALHAVSDRKDKPFIAINCGAIPDSLLESEFFGYAGGAFTGASAKGKIGKFELAHKGVLFLDEIGTLPLYLQVKLLRALQERVFTRLGSNRLIEVDIRIIAATNDDLPEMVRQGSFREDLFYRLNVVPLEIPPLRSRKEDLVALARYFLTKYCTLFHKNVPELSTEMIEELSAYPWPGNVRELENAMEFMVNMMESGTPLHTGLLTPKIRTFLADEPALPGVAGGEANKGNMPILPLKELERQAIASALRRFGAGAKAKRSAADALEIGLATLYRKIKEYNLE